MKYLECNNFSVKFDVKSVENSMFLVFNILSDLRAHSFFHPRHNGQGPPTPKDFLSQILSITFIFLS